MPEKEKNNKKHFPGHECPIDNIDDLEDIQDEELPGPMHDKAEKPTKLPGKTRAGGKESYYPMHRRRK